MRDRLGSLPEGFEFIEGARGVIACRETHASGLADAGFTADVRRASESIALAQESGREPLGRIQLSGTDALVRRFTHGGLARVLTGRRFSDPARPFDELRLSERLRGLGIPTPRVLAARAVQARGWGFELSLVVERLPGTVDVGRLLGEVRAGRCSKSVLRRAIGDAGELVGRLHRAGFLHADLQPANLLVAADGVPGAIVLDLDRSFFVGTGPLNQESSDRNLARLWRHLDRRERRYGPVLGPMDLALFLDRAGVPRADLDRRARRIATLARRGGLLHRLGWALERTFGRRHDERAAG